MKMKIKCSHRRLQTYINQLTIYNIMATTITIKLNDKSENIEKVITTLVKIYKEEIKSFNIQRK
jgi:hypothetical protein